MKARASRAPRRQVLGRDFYARDVLDVARDCIGTLLVHETPAGRIVGRVVEAEAYRGPEDRAAHSYGGRRTARTEVMFGPPGHVYVFFVYGMHWHVNLVTGPLGAPQAVLLRAVEPLMGVELMAERRGMGAERRELTNGPGKLCQAFGIDRNLYGADLCRGPLYLEPAPAHLPPPRVLTSPRIGIDYAGPWRDRPWRFFDGESPYVLKAARKPGPAPGPRSARPR
jgi:DNA-3-methyladenine glycosylase